MFEQSSPQARHGSPGRVNEPRPDGEVDVSVISVSSQPAQRLLAQPYRSDPAANRALSPPNRPTSEAHAAREEALSSTGATESPKIADFKPAELFKAIAQSYNTISKLMEDPEVVANSHAILQRTRATSMEAITSSEADLVSLPSYPQPLGPVSS